MKIIKFFGKTTFFLIVGLVLISPGFTKAASLSSLNFDVNPKTANPGATLTYSWRIISSSNQSPCGDGRELYWAIERRGDVPADRKVAASGTIKASEFIISSTQTKQGTFVFSPIGTIGSGTSEGLQLNVGCLREPGTNIILSSLAKSSIVTVNVTGQTSGAVAISFDASPKTATANGSALFNFTVKLSGKQPDFSCRDGSNAPVVWAVYMWPASQTDNFSTSTRVNQGALRVSDFGASSVTTVDKGFSKTVTVPNQNFVFKAQVTCDVPLGSDVLTTSSAVSISVGGGSGGTGTGTGSKPGETKTYSFEIPNPLKGGASDFTSLVKILAQWIFNLAIPIAVAMIVYSGILFLTAAGEPAKVTKARDVLKYAVIGLAIILIGSGFVTLIQSILELGGTGTTQDQGSGLPVEP